MRDIKSDIHLNIAKFVQKRSISSLTSWSLPKLARKSEREETGVAIHSHGSLLHHTNT
jgi:hypothetical protein